MIPPVISGSEGKVDHNEPNSVVDQKDDDRGGSNVDNMILAEPKGEGNMTLAEQKGEAKESEFFRANAKDVGTANVTERHRSNDKEKDVSHRFLGKDSSDMSSWGALGASTACITLMQKQKAMQKTQVLTLRLPRYLREWRRCCGGRSTLLVLLIGKAKFIATFPLKGAVCAMQGNSRFSEQR